MRMEKDAQKLTNVLRKPIPVTKMPTVSTITPIQLAICTNVPVLMVMTIMTKPAKMQVNHVGRLTNVPKTDTIVMLMPIVPTLLVGIHVNVQLGILVVD